MSASTAMPSAMPMPPRLMIVAGTPSAHIAPNVSSSTTGSVSERDQRAAPVQQEQQDHQHDDADLLAERAQQRVAHARRQIRAVVGRDDVDVGGDAGVEPLGIGRSVRQLARLARDRALDLVDERRDVGVAPGDDDPAHRAHAAQVGEARLHVLVLAHERDVASADGGLRRRRAADDRQRLEIAIERHVRRHAVPGAREDAARNAATHVGEGQAALAQLARLDVDAHLAADRRRPTRPRRRPGSRRARA